jgi:hypothetical protein
MALADKTMPPAIQRLNRLANLVVAGLFALALVDYSSVFR